MDIMKRDDYAGKARHIGEVVMKRYKELQEKYPVIGDVRGLGAMIGIELVKDKETKEPATELTAKLIQNAIQKGLLLENCGTAGNVVRFLAPLTMTDEQMEKGLEIFEASLRQWKLKEKEYKNYRSAVLPARMQEKGQRIFAC